MRLGTGNLSELGLEQDEREEREEFDRKKIIKDKSSRQEQFTVLEKEKNRVRRNMNKIQENLIFLIHKFDAGDPCEGRGIINYSAAT